MSTDDRHRPPVETGNLFAGMAAPLDTERFDTLVETAALRLERIVSTGQTTPAGEWFDQDRDEWVVLITGTAEVLFEGESAPRPLAPGDWLRIPAHARHRVTRTDPDRPTIWLALHHAPDPPPGRPRPPVRPQAKNDHFLSTFSPVLSTFVTHPWRSTTDLKRNWSAPNMNGMQK